ncbi:MAG TPA: diguanylate cyclase, partial [Gammaproteobacteria bacterium]|nr:diguanylate cyclase [Gammaproteobacteria bacterium]
MVEKRQLPILVISQSQNQAEKLNSLLRANGHVVHAAWANTPDDVQKSLQNAVPDTIFFFSDTTAIALDAVMQLRHKLAAATPILCVTKDATESEVAEIINQGARDLVSLEHPDRLEAVMLRELKIMRQRRELLTTRELVLQYQARFQSLMADTNDAIAYVQDGLHLEANPTWCERFGYSAEDIEGIPVMDLFYSEDQGTVKTALRDIAKGKAVDNLELRGVTAGGEPFELELEISAAKLRGEPCVELAIRGENDTGDMEERMAELAKRDNLTGLYHRHHFVDLLAEEMDRRRIDVAQAVLFIKPDKFSKIDDKVGPIASDTVLKLLGELLNEHLEEGDIGARFGGNIFTAILTRKDFKTIETWSDKFAKAAASNVFDAGGQS